MKLLVVEDDAKIAGALRRGLTAEGFSVEVAADGIEGLWRAREGSYDLIVLDVMLPGRNGYRVCADLRRAGDTTPILMLTAKDGDLDEAEGLDTGADDYLRKPFSFPVLVARVHALLRRAALGEPPPLAVGDLTARSPGPPGPPGRDGGRAHRPGVRPAGLPRAAGRFGGLQAADPRRCLGRRVRGRPQRGRGVRGPAAAQARRAVRPAAASRPSAVPVTGSARRDAVRQPVGIVPATLRARVTAVAALAVLAVLTAGERSAWSWHSAPPCWRRWTSTSTSRPTRWRRELEAGRTVRDGDLPSEDVVVEVLAADGTPARGLRGSGGRAAPGSGRRRRGHRGTGRRGDGPAARAGRRGDHGAGRRTASTTWATARRRWPAHCSSPCR